MMDRSVGSSSMMRANNETYSCTQEEFEEESGWTKYFEDLSNNNQASFCSNSLVSDASSGAAAAWRVSNTNSNSNNNSVPKKLKKTRTKKIGDHHDLEDTASSPVNSPKIGDLRPAVDDHMNPRKIDDHHPININILGKEHFGEMNQEDGDQNMSDRNTGLKKKGLCLVPLNLFVNYLV